MKYKHIIVTTLLSAGGRHAAASSSEDLQARLLHDMMHQYIEFIATGKSALVLLFHLVNACVQYEVFHI